MIDVSEIEALLVALSSDYQQCRLDQQRQQFHRRLEAGFMRLEGKTFREIGETLGVARARAAQMCWSISDVFITEYQKERRRVRQYRWPRYFSRFRENKQQRRVRKLREHVLRWRRQPSTTKDHLRRMLKQIKNSGGGTCLLCGEPGPHGVGGGLYDCTQRKETP